jgi:hypothetical protein
MFAANVKALAKAGNYVRLPQQMLIKGKMFIDNSKADWKISSR